MNNLLNNHNAWHQPPPILGRVVKTQISNPSGSIVLCHCQFDAFVGNGDEQPNAILGMCITGGGRTKRITDKTKLDDIWRPGRIGIALPSSAPQGFTPAMEMLGITFKLHELPACHGKKVTTEDLQQVSKQLFNDELVSAIMIALLREAEVHGGTSAFFEHGLSLALHHLVTKSTVCVTSKNISKLNHIFDYIEANLGEDIRVSGLSTLSGLNAKTLTRLFRQETGYTPHQYLTIRRMERAKELLALHTSITNIATTVGYANPAKFSAAFSRWVGCTPSLWKKQHH
ncbi:helix-turn-helix domain-containing protein [Pseudoalteromonas arctica]|uniref:Helix-turn-helix transcriptional regulator n=1 Tax=Pseudoalteromonas arctica TaxID=394751 RepID=A0A7Y0DQ92_9GAMM|nr:AraC family transcriptional regulator [Pseudoalteromonas arctica]NMM39596.1 helix-turn-helix transcriptional regulator [Pseudoalteromonas arctica]